MSKYLSALKFVTLGVSIIVAMVLYKVDFDRKAAKKEHKEEWN